MIRSNFVFFDCLNDVAAGTFLKTETKVSERRKQWSRGEMKTDHHCPVRKSLNFLVCCVFTLRLPDSWKKKIFEFLFLLCSRENEEKRTYAELTVEENDDDHVDEIAEEHRRVNVANEQGLFQVPVELDDRLEKIRFAKTKKTIRKLTGRKNAERKVRRSLTCRSNTRRCEEITAFS